MKAGKSYKNRFFKKKDNWNSHNEKNYFTLKFETEL